MTKSQILPQVIEAFNGNELAAKVWVDKYALKNESGEILEKFPAEAVDRHIRELIRIESNYENSDLSVAKLRELLGDFKFIVLSGGPMTGIGNNYQIASLSNCFVIGEDFPADSYGGIMKADQEQVQLMKRRGGVGHDLSHIRPAGSPVRNSAISSTGVVPFMERFSNSTKEVAQGGRRGALMLSIDITHPEANLFMDAKLEQNKVTGANISVKIPDSFMQAVENEGTYTVQMRGIGIERRDALTLWNKLTHNAWKSAEPGILFWDTILRESIPDTYADLGFKTVSTNPCGEIPLCPHDSCRLLALNLLSFVNNAFTPEAHFNWSLFREVIKHAVTVMDDIIDLELEKIDAILEKISADPESEEVKRTEWDLWFKIRLKAEQGRRKGIGITAEGDMLAALGIRYGSEQGIDFSTEVHKFLAIEAMRADILLAKDRGKFPIYDYERELNSGFIQRVYEAAPELAEMAKKYGRRSIGLLAIAPTGTISLMTQTTSGIENLFAPRYKRRVKSNDGTGTRDAEGILWKEFNVVHTPLKEWYFVNYKDLESKLQAPKEFIEELSDADFDTAFKLSPYHKTTAADVDWSAKVTMQGAVQKWVDHSISVTVNLPNTATKELVDELFMKAWKVGCKGITVYREGSREGVLITNTAVQAASVPKLLRRPKALQADVVRFQNNNEKWIAFVGIHNGNPYEIFTGLDEENLIPVPKSIKTGRIEKIPIKGEETRYDFVYQTKIGHVRVEGLSHQFDPEYWNYAKLISGLMRHGMPIVSLVKLIEDLSLNDSINTWKRGIIRAIKRYIPNGTASAKKEKCDNCGETSLIYQEGCLICSNCGTSKCG